MEASLLRAAARPAPPLPQNGRENRVSRIFAVVLSANLTLQD